MKAVSLLAICLSLALGPLAPANPVVPSPAATESCTMACCQGKKAAEHKDCAPACRCPVTGVVPAQTTAVLPLVSGICPPAGCPACWRDVTDERAPERNVRPPVPPPRA